jgi:hypothetical protein
MALSARAAHVRGRPASAVANRECLQCARRAIRNIAELRIIEVPLRGYRAGLVTRQRSEARLRAARMSSLDHSLAGRARGRARSLIEPQLSRPRAGPRLIAQTVPLSEPGIRQSASAVGVLERSALRNRQSGRIFCLHVETL